MVAVDCEGNWRLRKEESEVGRGKQKNEEESEGTMPGRRRGSENKGGWKRENGEDEKMGK